MSGSVARFRTRQGFCRRQPVPGCAGQCRRPFLQAIDSGTPGKAWTRSWVLTRFIIETIHYGIATTLSSHGTCEHGGSSKTMDSEPARDQVQARRQPALSQQLQLLPTDTGQFHCQTAGIGILQSSQGEKTGARTECEAAKRLPQTSNLLHRLDGEKGDNKTIEFSPMALKPEPGGPFDLRLNPVLSGGFGHRYAPKSRDGQTRAAGTPAHFRGPG